MNGVFTNALSKILADRSFCCFSGIGRSHDFTVISNRVFSLKYTDHNRSGTHESCQFLKKWTFTVDRIKSFGFTFGKVKHASSYNPETLLFKTSQNFTDQISLNPVRFDDG